MATTTATCSKLAIAVTVLSYSCMPLRDLDQAGSGQGGATLGTTSPGSGGVRAGEGGVGGSESPDVANANGGTPAEDGAVAMGGFTGRGGARASGGSAHSGGRMTSAGGKTTATGGTAGDTAGSTAGGAAGSPAGGTVASTGGIGTSSSGGAGGTTVLVAPNLPDIYDSPVQGDITYSAGASWDIDGAQWPAFEIHTPTASYWLVKADAAIVSINDTTGVQWINFASGFRPNRGVPNLGGCCQPGDPVKLKLPTMTTVIDPAFTITSTHLRLESTSDDGSYWLVWDFFQTHFTLTINWATKAFGFTYRGVPGGAIGPTDQLVLSGGTIRSASQSYNGDLPGPSEWAYLTHPAATQSLFLIQHAEDSLPETYQIADGDSAMFVFGSGQITQTPIRFSLGLVSSCDDQVVRDRITFVQNAIH